MIIIIFLNLINIKKKRFTLINYVAILTLLISLLSCGQPIEDTGSAMLPVATPIVQTLTPTPAIDTTKQIELGNELERRWLQKEPCAPPCWELITPGKTTMTEAVELLKKNALRQNVGLELFESLPNIAFITWKLVGRPHEIEMDMELDADSATQIILGFSPDFYTTFKLDEVIQVYGQPSHVVVSANRPPDRDQMHDIYYDIIFVYLNQGFLLDSPSLAINLKPALSGEIEFNEIVFFTPSEEGLKAGTHISLERTYYSVGLPWQGMQSFDFYCQQAFGESEDPDLCG